MQGVGTTTTDFQQPQPHHLQQQQLQTQTRRKQQVPMNDVKDWRPFVYGGVASITAEFGK